MMASRHTIVVLAFLLAFGANAQESTTAETTTKAEVEATTDTQQENSKSRMEKIEVTGSHIKRIDVEGPSPVLILDKEYLDKSGHNSVADVLRDTTVAGLGGQRETGLTGGANGGAATTSIRGMGANSILVLLDGKRLPSIGGSSTVDLNLIPMAAIERVEILKDGASAIYGSDALGGVINFKTKKDYDGAEIFIRHSTPTSEGGGARSDITGTYGYSGSKFNFLGVLNYRSSEKMHMRDREFTTPTEAFFSPTGSPGSWKDTSTSESSWTAGGGATPCTGPVKSNGTCAFDYSPYMHVIPELTQYSTLLSAEYEFNESMKMYARGLYMHRDVRSQLAPPPDSFADETDIGGINSEIPNATAAGWGLTPTDPFVDVKYRLVEEAGPRVNNVDTDTYGVTTGVKGFFGDSWDWEASGNYSESKTINVGVSGYADKQILLDLAKQSPSKFNPFAASGSKSDISSAAYQPRDDIQSNIGGLKFSATGELVDLPAGPLALAVGVAGNWQTFEQRGDAITNAGRQWGGGASAEGAGRRDFQSVYAEFSIPVLSNLETQVAGRMDNYSDFGSTFNPKLGFRYTPVSMLMLRGSWGTGFRAPTLENLYEAQVVGFPFGQDPQTGDEEQFKTVSGGNTTLKEETSESLNVGAVVQILDNLSFSTDYYYNNQKDVIVAVSNDPNQVLFNIFAAEDAGLDLSQFGITVIRNPAVTGSVERIVAPNLNVASRETEGLEFRLAYRMKLGSNWNMSWIVDHSMLLKLDEEPFPGMAKQNRAGHDGNPYWRNNVSLGLGNGTWGFNFLAKTIGKQTYSATSPSNFGQTRDHTELDVQVQYATSWKGIIAGGARNIFDTDRPNRREHLSTGFLNNSIYDPFGRVVYLSYTQGF